MIVSIHFGNIDQRIIDNQKKVFEHFGFEIVHRYFERQKHGTAMDTVLRNCENDAILFADIDCIPLSRDAVLGALAEAKIGCLHGAMGYASHIKDSSIYVHPCWLAVDPNRWREYGKPSCEPNSSWDTAGRLTEAWSAHNAVVSILAPTHVEIPKWDTPACRMKLGIGTTYGNACYHLFESRFRKHTDRFITKCREVIDANP